MAEFSTIDMIILCGYLLIILAVGIRASRSVKNLQDYSVGGRSYSAFFIFTTLSAAFLGGGFTMGLAEKVFTLGLAYVIALWGFSCKEMLTAWLIVPRMEPFKKAMSVGDIMGQLYGQNAKIFTGIAGALVCAGIAGAQFSAFGHVTHVLLGIPATTGILFGSVIVIFYSTLGGMRSVVINDTVHFCVLIVALPLVAIFGLYYVGGFDAVWSKIPPTHGNILTSLPPLALLGLFLSFFFGETLVPPYVQRLLIGKSLKETARGTFLSGFLSIPFFLIVGFIGVLALAIDPHINPNLALPFVIQMAMPIGLKGLAIVGIMAVLMSSADSFLNAAAVCATHDVLKPLRRSSSETVELRLTRWATFIMGAMAVIFSLRSESAIDALLYAYNFWTPFILVPLVAGILGYNASPRTFWVSSTAGICAMLSWQFFMTSVGNFDAAIAGIFFNCITFVVIRSFESNVRQKLSPQVEEA
ncbi:MAG: sodium:solute symporter family protein [Proteobacteria bacterium]|nr:sodium:solute symporter family protein [Pseudomonadota bacterium]